MNVAGLHIMNTNLLCKYNVGLKVRNFQIARSQFVYPIFHPSADEPSSQAFITRGTFPRL